MRSILVGGELRRRVDALHRRARVERRLEQLGALGDEGAIGVPHGPPPQEAAEALDPLVADAEPQVEYDENGDAVPQATPEKTEPKKLEDDPVLKKALEVLG